MTELEKYEKLTASLEKRDNKIEAGKMFGKECLKISGKAFAVFHQKKMVFKLEGKSHEKAMSFKGSKLWDPSGKKRPMKEWVQVSYEHASEWSKLANSASKYVQSTVK